MIYRKITFRIDRLDKGVWRLSLNQRLRNAVHDSVTISLNSYPGKGAWFEASGEGHPVLAAAESFEDIMNQSAALLLRETWFPHLFSKTETDLSKEAEEFLESCKKKPALPMITMYWDRETGHHFLKKDTKPDVEYRRMIFPPDDILRIAEGPDGIGHVFLKSKGNYHFKVGSDFEDFLEAICWRVNP